MMTKMILNIVIYLCLGALVASQTHPPNCNSAIDAFSYAGFNKANSLRQAASLPALKFNYHLYKTAAYHVQDLTKYHAASSCNSKFYWTSNTVSPVNWKACCLVATASSGDHSPQNCVYLKPNEINGLSGTSALTNSFEMIVALPNGTNFTNISQVEKAIDDEKARLSALLETDGFTQQKSLGVAVVGNHISLYVNPEDPKITCTLSGQPTSTSTKSDASGMTVKAILIAACAVGTFLML